LAVAKIKKSLFEVLLYYVPIHWELIMKTDNFKEKFSDVMNSLFFQRAQNK